MNDQYQLYADRVSVIEMLMYSGDVNHARRRNTAVKRIALSLIEKSRMKKRKSGAGARRQMGEEEEQFLAECLFHTNNYTPM